MVCGRTTLPWISLVMIGCLVSCGTLTVTDVAPDELVELHNDRNADLATESDKLVGSLVTSGYTPGAVVGIFEPGGATHFYGYGVADQTTHLKMDENTEFAAGSISKGFLAAMTAELVDEKKLSWDDTLAELYPDIPLSPDAARITLRQLATHTSGLPRQPITLETLSYFVEYLFTGESFYTHINRQYILDYLSSFENSEPGRIIYSNIGYGLIADILQTRTHKSIETLLEERITKPLKLHCTGYAPEALPCNSKRAHGYAGDSPRFILRGHPTPDWDFTPFMRGAAALHSTARDLLTFAAAHLNERTRLNQILGQNLVEQYRDPDDGIGTGWTVTLVEGEPIDYEIGLVAGYTAYVGVDPKYGNAVVLIQNAFNWDSSAGAKLLVYLRTHPKAH